MRNQNLIGMY